MSGRTGGGSKRRLKLRHMVIPIVLILLGGMVVYRLSLRGRLQARFEVLHAAGCPVTLAELDQWYQRPSSGDNAAQYVTTAMTYLQLPDSCDAETLPLLGQAELPARTQPLAFEMCHQIARVLRDNETALDTLDGIASMTSSRYPVDLTRGHATRLPHIGPGLRQMVCLLCLRAILEAERDRPTQAVDALTTALAVANSLAQEPVTVSQLMRPAYQAIVIAQTDRALNRMKPGANDLLRLQERLLASYDPNAVARAFIGELCVTTQALRHPKSAGLDLPRFAAQEGPSLLQVQIAQTLGQVDRYLLKCIDLTERRLAVMALPTSQRPEAAREIETQANHVREDYKPISHFMPPFNPSFIINDLVSLARIRVAATALAVERYRLAEGALPEDLTALVPAFLQAVPDDPFDERPLRYEKRQPGFVVYSIGTDVVDDGGKERPPRQRGSQPAPTYDLPFIVER